MSIKHNILKTAAIVAVTGAAAGGVTVAAEKGVFHDGSWDIDNSPAVTHKLETTIEPEMVNLGGLMVRLSQKAEDKAGDQDWQDTSTYDSKTGTVTIEATNTDSAVYGGTHVEGKFGAIPGSHDPDPNNVLYIEADQASDENDPIPTTKSFEFAAPGQPSYDKDGGHSPTDVYSAMASSGIEYADNHSLDHAGLLTTRNVEMFKDSSWGDYKHNPLPTARVIVREAGKATEAGTVAGAGTAADIIADAFEQPRK